MCGLVGIAGSLKTDHDKLFKQLLIVDSLRGTDSTGMCLVSRDTEDTLIAKALGNPFDFMETTQFTRAFVRVASVIMGHNRYATQGKVNKANAHPFDFSDIVGMHNGTLRNKHNLLDSRHFDVDSENLYHHMNEEGLDSLMDVMQGAWSLVWWNKATKELNFLRNDERPMHIAHFNDGKTIAWASEKAMLELVLGRNGVKVDSFHETGVNLHYRFHLNKQGELEKPIVVNKPAKIPNPPVYQTFTAHAGTNRTTQVATVQQQSVAPLAGKKSIASQVVRGYVSSRSIKLELVDYGIDKHGQRFIHCIDEKTPYVQVRLYVNKGMDYAQEIAEGGRFIRGDIKDVNIQDKNDIYYKVSVNSVVVLPAIPKPIIEPTVLNSPFVEETPEDGELFKDHRGKYLVLDKWVQQYGCCGACDGYVNPLRPHKFTVSGECLCDNCVSDAAIMSMVALM